MTKKKIIAIILFLFLGLFMFTFANPGEVNNELRKPDNTKEETKKEEAKEEKTDRDETKQVVNTNTNTNTNNNGNSQNESSRDKNDTNDSKEEHYTIVFEAGKFGTLNGSAKSITYGDVLVGTQIAVPEVTAIAGYKFDSWNPSVSTTVTGDATYTATYFEDKNDNDIDDSEEDHFKVTFVVSPAAVNVDGELVAELVGTTEYSVVEGATYAAASVEVPGIRILNEYYEFVSWTPELFGETDTVTSDIEFVATFAPINDENENDIADEEEYRTIIYTDGLEGAAFEDVVFTEQLDGLATPEFGENPSYGNLVFLGWTPEVSETVNGDATYTAVWQSTYRVIHYYHKNNSVEAVNVDGENGSRLGTVGEEVRVTEDDMNYYNPGNQRYKKFEYDFRDSANVTVGVVNKEGTLELQLHFRKKAGEKADYYTVLFKSNYSPETIATQNIAYGEETALTGNTFTRDNYTFLGWAVTPDGEVVYEDGATVLDLLDYTEYEGDGMEFTLYAVWEEIEEPTVEYFTVTYTDGVDDEEVFADQITGTLVAGDSTPVFEGEIVREGYRFLGWTPEVSETVTETVTYVATWEEIEEPTVEYFTVTYTDGVDDEEVFADQITGTLVAGDSTPVFEGEIVREGYRFLGWAPEVSETVTETVTYVAEWQKLYIITFNDSDDSLIDKQLLAEGEEVTVPEVQAEEGYAFLGWTPEVEEIVTSDATYTAVYTDVPSISFTVDKAKNGKSATIKATVTDDDGIAEVKLDGNAMSKNGNLYEYTVSSNGTYTITAKDSYNVESSIIVNVTGLKS